MLAQFQPETAGAVGRMRAFLAEPSDGYVVAPFFIGGKIGQSTILITSGSDWTDRMKRLAARAPDLDIFSQSFVLRDNAGWQITDAGRVFLDFLQTPIQPKSDERQAPDVAAIPVLPPAASPITLIGVNRRRPLPRLAGRRRPSAAA